MSVLEKLEFWIGANGAAAIREFEQVGRAAERDLGKAQDHTRMMSDRFLMAGGVMIGASAALGTALWKAGEAASDLNETMSQVDNVFGSSATKIHEWAKTAQDIGLSERAANDAAVTFGLFFTNAGIAADRAADMSIEMTTLAADMASFKNTSPEQAIQAIGSALRGETEPIRYYGVTINEATLKQYAMEHSLKLVRGQLDQNTKMQAVYSMILEQTTAMQGDFNETVGESAANQQRVFKATMENTAASIGTSFLPFMSKALNVVSTLAGGFGDLDEKSGHLLGTIGGFTMVGLGALGALSLLAGAAGRVREGWDTMVDAIRRAHDGLSNAIQNVGGLAQASNIASGAMLAVSAVALVAAMAYEAFRSDQQAVADATRRYTDNLKEAAAAQEGLNGITLATKMFQSSLGDKLRDQGVQWGKLATEIRENESALDRYHDVSIQPDLLKDRLQEDADAGSELAKEILRIFDVTGMTDKQKGQFIRTLETESDGLKNSKDATDEETQAKKENADATAGQIQQIDDLTNKLKALMDPLFGMRDAEDKLQAAQKQVADATLAQFFAQKTLDQAIREHGPNSKEAAEAQRDLEKAVQGVTDANKAQVSAAYAMEQAERTLEKAMLDGSVTVDGARAKIDEWRAAGWITEEQAASLRDRVGELANKYGGLPPSVATNVSAPGLDDVLRQARELWNIFHDSDFQAGYGQGLGVYVNPAKPFGSAVGRYLPAGSLSWVGESGVELFEPQVSGFVKNAQSRAVKQAQSSDAGPSVVIHAQTGATASDIGREVAWAIRTSGR